MINAHHHHQSLRPASRYCWAVALVCLAPLQVSAAPPDGSGDIDAAVVRPFVDDTTCLVVKIDLARVALPDLGNSLDSLPAGLKTAYASSAAKMAADVNRWRELAGDKPVFATIGFPISKTRIPIRVFVTKTSDEQADKILAAVKDQFSSQATISGDYIVMTPHGDSIQPRSILDQDAAGQTRILEAFRSVADYPVQLLVLPPEHVWRTVRELAPELPHQLGGGPSSVLTEGVQWAAVGADPARLRTEIVIHSASADAARDFAARLPVMIRAAHDSVSQHQKFVPADVVQLLLDKIKPQVEGSRVTIRVDGLEKADTNLSLLANVLQSIEQRVVRHGNQQRFKQILLGMHNYHDTHGSLPPVDKYRDANGKPYLSWRVHILPFVEQEALYRQFRLEEPWDSPHNRALIAKMPDIFASDTFDPLLPDKVKPGHTTFLAPAGENAIFGGSKSTRLSQIRDGSSATIALVEVTPQRAVPWTAPEDFAFDLQNPLDGISIGADKKWLSAFADGSVSQLRADLAAETVLHLFQMNDGQAIDFDQLR